MKEDKGFYWTEIEAEASPEVFELIFGGWENCFWLDNALDASEASVMGGGAETKTLSLAGDPAADEAGHFWQGFEGTETPKELRWPLGWVGWFGYETGAQLIGGPYCADAGANSAWMLCERAVYFRQGKAQIIAWGRRREHQAARRWVEETARTLGQAPAAAKARPRFTVAAQPFWRHGDREYLAMIQQGLEHIRRGDLYQLCLTNQLQVPVEGSPVAAFAAFLSLRELSPTRFCGYIKLAGRQFISASPELFLQVSGRSPEGSADDLEDETGAAGGTASEATGEQKAVTEPIKGTRPRGDTLAEDQRLSQELAADPKERAENLMIVDLMRNDFSRVCRPESVQAQALWQVNTYQQWHQLVSRVTGNLASGRTALDLIRATFPAGSMTGAPKLEAVKRLFALEGGPRGIYAGAFGQIGLDGSCCLAMSIRGAVWEDSLVTIGSGGGIVIDSDPDAELAEIKLKSAAVLKAIID